jgi:hypothetical protein
MKLFVSLVVLLTVLSCNAFRLTQQKRYSVTAQRAAITPSSRSSSNPISDFFDSMFKVFPEVLSSTKPVNYDNVIRDLPAFSKAGGHQMTLSKWRKYYKSESGFKRQDIIDDFNAKYVPSKRQIKDLKVTKLYQLLLDLDEQELISELNAIISNMDEYEGDFIGNQYFNNQKNNDEEDSKLSAYLLSTLAGLGLGYCLYFSLLCILILLLFMFSP